ncbi:MAG: hypothetical protein JXA37_06560 [Chloroflexia bacterium]|nr:hypothetical protein [Chloroflexia bacterium]
MSNTASGKPRTDKHTLRQKARQLLAAAGVLFAGLTSSCGPGTFPDKGETFPPPAITQRAPDTSRPVDQTVGPTEVEKPPILPLEKYTIENRLIGALGDLSKEEYANTTLGYPALEMNPQEALNETQGQWQTDIDLAKPADDIMLIATIVQKVAPEGVIDVSKYFPEPLLTDPLYIGRFLVSQLPPDPNDKADPESKYSVKLPGSFPPRL